MMNLERQYLIESFGHYRLRKARAAQRSTRRRAGVLWGPLLATVLVAGLWAMPAAAQTPVVEAKSADEATVLQVNEDGGLLGLGVFETGVIPVEGTGTRLMWYPAKAAFRAGRVGGFSSDGSEWDAANVGEYSVAFGRNTTASGIASTAMGSGATASGFISTSRGNSTTASGGSSTAMGGSTTASGERSTALGDHTTASGSRSTAMGNRTTASGENTTAMGFNTTAQSYASLAIGRFNSDLGNPVSWEDADPLFVAGNGSSNVSRSNAMTLQKNGNLTIAGSLSQNSDRRLKTGITPLGDVLTALGDIQPVRYRFREGTSRPAGPQLGLIAQEVAQAFPELVTRGADGYLSVAYPKLTAVLLGGLQEQQTQIQAQREEIEALRTENEATQERLAALEARAQDDASVPAGWSAAGLLAVLVLGGLFLRRRPGALVATMLVAGLWALPATAQTTVVEATNADETTVLQVNDDGGLLGLGVFETGVIPVEGPGTRLMWHPAKAALRAGRVGAFSDGGEWDDANVGFYSIAFGRNTTASGNESTAMGAATTASGLASTAIGFSTTASETVSTAMGQGTTASGVASTAMGQNTTASGFASTAMGQGTTAGGFASTAMGQSTTAGGAFSFAAGRRAVVRDGDHGTFAWADSEDADFTSTGEDQFLIRAAGGVGIGTNSPNFQLSLGDKLSHTKIALYETSPTNHFGMGVVAGQFSFHLNGPGARYAFYDSDTQNQEIFTIQGSGNVAVAGSLTESSDRRLKTDIAPLGPALARLLALDPVRYRFKDSTRRPAGSQLGLIAQEVAQAFPELVTRGADGYLSVAYPKLTAVLLKGVQEQQTEIKVLRAENVLMQERLAALEASVQDDTSVLAGWSGWGAAGLLAVLVLGGLLIRRRPGTLVAATLVVGLWALPAAAQTPVVEAKNADETTVLQVSEDGSLLGLGVIGTGVIPAEGAGTRLMWHPGKAAFRAGRVGGFFSDGSEWDEANVGLYSTAFGVDATASGFASMAMGQNTIASGNFSTAMGLNTTAQAFASLVIGRNNVVDGNSGDWSPSDPLFVAGNGSSDNPSNALTLLKSGHLTIAGDLTQNSDRRLKTDIAPLGPALARLLALDPVRYRFKDGTNRPPGPQLGLIAQEVAQAFPELVTRGADGYLSVAYPKLTAVLLGGLQEQQDRIDAQQNEIEALRAENEATQARLAALEARGREDASATTAGWSGWGAAGLFALLLLGGLLVRRRQSAVLAAVLVAGLWALPAGAQTPVVEATNADEATVLQVNDDGGLLGLGVFETGVIPIEEAGTRLMWHPAKAAFRAGTVGFSGDSDGSEWDESNIGIHSIAMGSDVTASAQAATALGLSTTASALSATALGNNTEAVGPSSTATGNGTTASGQSATALGQSTTASGSISTAMGFRATASGNWSTALGNNTTASGFRSTATGNESIASGENATAIGDRTRASGFAATAMGAETTAGGNWSTAMGNFTAASGLRSTAMGFATEASGNRSTAMGHGTTSQAYASLAIGRFNVATGNSAAWVATDPLLVAGNGTSEDPSNALTLLKDGNLTIAGTLTENSDRRLKTDIVPLTDVLVALEAIQPVRYRFREGTSRPSGPQLGLIAQEVEQAFPELVTRGADGYLSVAYPKLTAVLLGGLQEQQAQMEAQREEIEALRTAHAAVQEQLVRLATRLEELATARDAISPPVDATTAPRPR